MNARPRTLLSALLTPLLLGGCYGYYERAETTPAVGRRVQLSLSDSGAVMLASQIGPTSDAIEGRLMADTANSYLLSVFGVHRRSGDDAEWRGEQIAVPRPFVTRVAERRFSIGRTALASVLTGAALVAAQQAFSGRGFGSGGGTSGTGGTK